MKWLVAVLLVALVLLQYRLWLTADGVSGVLQLKTATQAQQQQNASLSERNRQLAAEVRDLKQGYAALEERARTDLGMIGRNETFYQVVSTQTEAGHSAPAPTTATPPLRTAAR